MQLQVVAVVVGLLVVLMMMMMISVYLFNRHDTPPWYTETYDDASHPYDYDNGNHRYMDIVVARHTEDVAWLRHVLAMNVVSRVYLYNKGAPDIPLDIIQHPKTHYTELPNLGRETDTYLNHIVRCYEQDLGDRIVFTQGNPFEQAPDFMEFLKMHEHWDAVYQPISSIWFMEAEVPPREYYETHGRKLGNATVLEVEFYLDTLAPIGFEDIGLPSVLGGYILDPNCIDGGVVTKGVIQDVVARYNIPIKPVSENVGTYHYGAIFAVPKSTIQKHEIDLYRRLQGFTAACAYAGYVMERIWSMMFRADPQQPQNP
jgi:hypothetical protein